MVRALDGVLAVTDAALPAAADRGARRAQARRGQNALVSSSSALASSPRALPRPTIPAALGKRPPDRAARGRARDARDVALENPERTRARSQLARALTMPRFGSAVGCSRTATTTTFDAIAAASVALMKSQGAASAA